MQFLTTTLIALAALTAAAPPTNSTPTLEARSFSGSVNFYKRYDCKNPCVENGYCLSGQANKGMKGSTDSWIGWDSGCWDRPAGVHSLRLSISNGHKYTGIDKTCAQWKADGFAAKQFPLGSSKKKGVCNVLPGDKIKAVFYNW